MMRWARTVAALLCTGAVHAVQRNGVDYHLVDDVQVEHNRPRSFGALGAALYKDNSRLWPNGQVNYWIDTGSTNPDNPSDTFLTASDTRILGAVLEVETKTCIKFTKCESQSECTTPYIHFISDKDACNSPVGVSSTGINQINLGPQCGLITVAHEILHSLGLAHEHTRLDRDNYVYVDSTQIRSGVEVNFEKVPEETGRDIGPYDYASIMHYSATAFATGAQPTIVSQFPIGLRTKLSDGDVAAVNFMYNNCKSTFDKPTCIASVSTDSPHLIGHNKAWTVEFNALFSSTMTVSFDNTTAPGNEYTTTVDGGDTIGTVGKVQMTFTPQTKSAEYTLAATFSGDGTSTTCTVNVVVAESTNVCFGLAASDPKVCSGRGTCGSDLLAPCTCSDGYGGLDCSGFGTCPTNYLHPMDSDTATWKVINTEVDPQFSAAGGGSMRVGSEADPAVNSQAYLDLVAASQPQRITYYYAIMDGPSPSLSFRNGDTQCFSHDLSTTFRFAGQSASTVAVAKKRFYHIDLRLDWGNARFDVYIDGRRVLQDVAMQNSECGASGASPGLSRVVFFGNGWLDEFHVWCTQYIIPTGTAAESLSQDFLRQGGAQLTLTLVGDTDTWANTAVGRQAIVDAIVSLYPTGFNTYKSTLVDSALVSISGASAVVGPFRANANYPTLGVAEFIQIPVTGAMFASGAAPLGFSNQELGLQIPGVCASGTKYGFDSASFLSESDTYLEIDNADGTGGSGSLKIIEAGWQKQLNVYGVRPSRVTYTAKMADTSSQLTLKFVSTGTASNKDLRLVHGLSGAHAYNNKDDNSWQFPGSVSANTWTGIGIEFDWSARTFSMAISTGGGAANIDLPAGMDTIDYIAVYAGAAVPVSFDELDVQCPVVQPSYSLGEGVACVDPEASNVPALFNFYPGSNPLSLQDEIAVAEGIATSCDNVDCSKGGCSSSVGVLTQELGRTTWNAGVLDQLIAGLEYKVCYKLAGGAFELLSAKFRTCGEPPLGYTLPPLTTNIPGLPPGLTLPPGITIPGLPPGVTIPPGLLDSLAPSIPGLLASYAPPGFVGFVTSPSTNQTSTPIYNTNCSAFMISKQGTCIRKRTMESCTLLPDCSWCRIGTYTDACLYTKEACGLFAVGIAELNYTGSIDGSNDSCPRPTGVFWSVGSPGSAMRPSLLGSLAAALAALAAHAALL